MALMPGTNERVILNTAKAVNAEIERQTEDRIAYYASHPEEIDARIVALEHEWDIERTLEANAATVSVAGLALGLFLSRKFFFIPAVVGGFLLQHALQGWCPPLPVLRRMGVRTQTEIERERYALKALRGDFATISTSLDISQGNALTSARRVLELVK